MFKNLIISILLTAVIMMSDIWVERPAGLSFFVFFISAMIVYCADSTITSWRERSE